MDNEEACKIISLECNTKNCSCCKEENQDRKLTKSKMLHEYYLYLQDGKRHHWSEKLKGTITEFNDGHTEWHIINKV
jgi:hypothetical protein